MSIGNGLALIFFGDPLMDDIKTKGGSRSATRGGTRDVQAAPTGLPIDEDVAKFEVFLEHCDFILYSSNSNTTVPLLRSDCCANGIRPDATPLLPKVSPSHWKAILSRYRFNVATKDEDLLHRDIHWTLILREIKTSKAMPTYNHGEEYIASVVCFPQSWLSWVENEWFLNNIQRYWFIQGSMEDSFGIPSAESTRNNEFSDCADGRKHFRIFNGPNSTSTKIDEGATAVDVSELPLQSGYTDHHKGVYFPGDGIMYVILFDMPSAYKIARNIVSNMRECVLCSDERPATDLGLVFGTCGHYICYQCSKDYEDNLDKETRCYYCRRPTSVKMTRAPEGHEHAVGVKRHSSDISSEQAQMKQIMQRMQRI